MCKERVRKKKSKRENKRVRNCGRATISSHFGIPKVIACYQKLYEEVIDYDRPGIDFPS